MHPRGWRLHRTLEEGGGRYRYLRDIGSGGMARIVEVEHLELGTRHAMKILKVLSPALRSRLLAEGRLQAKLRHPNIVAVHDVVRLGGGFPALVLDRVDGPSLDALRDRVRLTIPEVDLLARGMLRGLIAAHRLDCIHRDLKPGNVLIELGRSGVVPKIADFGLAKSFAEEGESRTLTGMSMGTPRYMAPEQYANAKTVDVRADLFSMGTILYELLTGESCFPKADFLTVYGRAKEGIYTPVRERVPDAPQRMVAAIDAALRPDPADRPADARALLELWEAGEHEPQDVWTQERLERLREVGRVFTETQVAAERPTEYFPAERESSGDEAVTVLDLPDARSETPPPRRVEGPQAVEEASDDPPPEVVVRSLVEVAAPVLAAAERDRGYPLLERALWAVVVSGAFGFSVLVGLLLARWGLGSM